ncbi:hypothetical protein [Polaribacter sp. SA4-12]|uniref:hypothetical protein n=1 Tax=Polaribacter sp. SA4-12 TaxID=1312072 RepID=UPI000B3D45E7|nr:hypothetical protein [Polaribacter sp. SA4-12]ARV15207.1 hypothetical protein BTO07_08635 [Polaribacter sp. SA4-12]
MRKEENNPISKFKHMLKGSSTARNLSFIYVLLSLLLAFKMRAELEYVVPLIIGALLIIWYTLTHLSLKNINLKEGNLKSQFNKYQSNILKREKYESTIYFIWLLTIIPAYLVDKEITTFTVLKYMIILFIIFAFGNNMFKKVKNRFKRIRTTN